MSPEKICLTKGGENREKRFGAAYLLAEIFKGMRQSVTNWKPERPQTERVKENTHLMSHPQGAVLEVAIVEAQTGIKEDSFDPVPTGDFDLARKIIVHPSDRIGAQFKVGYFADIRSVHVADDDRGVVGGNEPEKFLGVF